jgi:peptide/nickel transport system substrate-binding protein
MSNSIRFILSVSLCISPCLLMYSRSESTEASGQPALEALRTRYGGIYRRELGSDPPTLDPAYLTETYGRAVASQIFDGLVQFDAHLRPIPAIAELWEASRDGRVWTFFLRRGVKFHHSREVTAHDFVYSFTRLLQLGSPGPVANFFTLIQGATDFMRGKAQGVKGLKAIDRYTLQIVLEEPYMPSLAVLGLTNAAVVPQEEVERLGDRFGRFPVGAGPFKFSRWEPGHEIVLEAHENYYEGRPFLNAVLFKIMPGDRLEKRFTEFLKGNLEETIIPSGKAEEARLNSIYQKYQRIHKPTLSFLYIGFNTQLKPFDDRRVRQAFNYAVNVEEIVKNITKMGSIPARGALPPGMPGYDPELQGYSYNLAEAKRLLSEAGYPNGTGFPSVQLWSVHKAETTRAELAAYQRYLADLGVKVEIHYAPDWPSYKAMLEQGKLPMFRLIWVADIPDPDNTLYALLQSTSSTNYRFYRNPMLDQLLEEARKEVDDTQRLALYREVERIAIADAPWIPQHYSVLDYLFQPYVQGVEVTLLGKRLMPLKKVWFKEDLIESSAGAAIDVQPSR